MGWKEIDLGPAGRHLSPGYTSLSLHYVYRSLLVGAYTADILPYRQRHFGMFLTQESTGRKSTVAASGWAIILDADMTLAPVPRLDLPLRRGTGRRHAR